MIPRDIWAAGANLAAFATIGIFVDACPPNPTPVVPTPDAADAVAPKSDTSVIDCQAACDAMKRVGCVVLSDCAAVICKVNADVRFAHYNLDCLVKVLVPADVAACGAGCRVDQ